MKFMHRNRNWVSLLALAGLLISIITPPASAEYNPTLGRWLQPDPHGTGLVLSPGLRYHGANPSVTVSMAYQLQYADGMNFYQFVKSNPISGLDPSGQFAFFDTLNAAANRAMWHAHFFAAAHPGAIQFVGGLLAAANLYAFATYEEARAIVIAQPNPLGILAADIKALGIATSEILSYGGAITGLTRASAQSRFLAEQASRLIQAEAAQATTPRIQISRSRLGEAAQHIADAQAAGQPRVLTIDRHGARARRRVATAGHPTSSEVDLDEYPPAVFKEGGHGASIRPINISDNRAAGATIRHQIQSLPDGTEVILEVVP